MSVKIGYNMTAPHHLEMVNDFFRSGQIDYVELLADNFFNFQTSEIEKIKAPLALHIMRSAFLEEDRAHLSYMAKSIQAIMTVRPMLYVSDHILKFSHNGHTLPYLQEIDYPDIIKSPDAFHARLRFWMAEIGSQIFFENAASLDARGTSQHHFIEQVLIPSGGGILLDLTNLFISIKNGGAVLDDWKNIISKARHFHIGSYNLSSVDTAFHIDSHASEISDEFEQFCHQILPLINLNADIYVTYERDAQEDIASVSLDLSRTREMFRLDRHVIFS